MLVRRIICFLLQDFVQGLQSVLNGFLRRSSDGKFLCRYIEYIMFFTFQFKICPKFDNRITACPPPSDDGALPEPFSQYLLQLKQAGIQLGQISLHYGLRGDDEILCISRLPVRVCRHLQQQQYHLEFSEDETHNRF